MKLKNLALLPLLLALAPAAFSQTAGSGEATEGSMQRVRQSRHSAAPMQERLGLDSATTARIAAMRDEHQKERIAIQAKLRSARIDFRAAMRKNPADEKTAMAKQKEMSSYREKMESSALEHRLAVEKMLTPEQREAFRERGMSRRSMREDGWMGKHGGGHNGGRGMMKHRHGGHGDSMDSPEPPEPPEDDAD